MKTKSVIKQIYRRGTEKSTIWTRPHAFIYCKQRESIESRDHHNAKWLFTTQAHQPTKISPILQARFLYWVNIYKYDIWNGYSSRFWHYFRSGNYWMIHIWHLSWPIFCYAMWSSGMATSKLMWWWDH